MSSESDFLEIIILGAIAAFLIYRLVATLGQNTGFQQPLHKENLGDLGQKASSAAQADKDEATAYPKAAEKVPEHLQEGVQALTKSLPDFSLKRFLEGATDAYEMIVKAFAEGDLETLKNLMDPEIYGDFETAIRDRQEKNRVLTSTIVRVGEVSAKSVVKTGTKASITVTFVTEQNHILKNDAGEILEGSPHQVEEVTDVWTFSKSLRSHNPNWTLVATGE